jgi:hypothetical protein
LNVLISIAAALSLDVKCVQLSSGDGTEVTSQACPALPQPLFNGIGAPSVPEIFSWRIRRCDNEANRRTKVQRLCAGDARPRKVPTSPSETV